MSEYALTRSPPFLSKSTLSFSKTIGCQKIRLVSILGFNGYKKFKSGGQLCEYDSRWQIP